MSCFSTSIRVYIEDTDAGGIVFYANYLKFMERARTEMLRSLGFSKPALIDDTALLVVASVSVDYKRPARLDDLLTVTAEVVEIGRVYVVFKQQVFRGEELISDGEIKVVCVDSQSLRPISLPENMLEKIKEYSVSQELLRNP
ncbi:tol-pal system-associated acyl-CoA thioesterase [Sessilibacter sp. MAH2]